MIGIGIALVMSRSSSRSVSNDPLIQRRRAFRRRRSQVADADFAHHGGIQRARDAPRDGRRQHARGHCAELSAVRAANVRLEARTEDLQRSNAELEQFAYVASHDLQEPLRKVASFCQLLQRRYAGRLDEKADQYIEHAVDGAKRMQALINDLLAFSRVGRTAQRREQVSCGVLLAQAWANLGPAVRQSHATIEVGDLPVVVGEASLLTAVFQNLLSNALKFVGDQAPRISVSARRDGGTAVLIQYGRDPRRVRRSDLRDLPRCTSRYPGTVTGCLCRKVIEYHGGRIWLDTTVTSGARFCFTLPAPPEMRMRAAAPRAGR
jgi:light-regulated signal transduction histidine kinase (bacteriophytochrome)